MLCPTRENYEEFAHSLIRGISNLDDGMSLLVYGSFARDDYTPGRSDIDAILVLPNIISDKRSLKSISKIYTEAQQGNHVPFQLTVTDKVSLQDGRLNPYMADFEKYLKSDAVLLVGDNPLRHMNCLHAKDGILTTLTFNFRKARSNLCQFDFELEENPRSFFKYYVKALDACVNASRKIPQLMTGEPVRGKFEGKLMLPELFPTLDLTILNKLEFLFSDAIRLQSCAKEAEHMRLIWEDSLTFFEELVQAYIEHNKQSRAL